jgi:UDP-N-acetylmuramoyl-tripeptide--D-alanyl-D-alanine ligase
VVVSLLGNTYCRFTYYIVYEILEGINLKHFHLSNIISNVIYGEFIQGHHDLIIHNVAVKPKDIKNRTLYFDIKKNLLIDLNSIPKNNLIVIVTDNLRRYKGLGDNITLIKVKNASDAYWNFIDYYRNQFDIPAIGVTGTCGKTTTKEMIKHILSSKYRNIVATDKSFNGGHRNLNYLMQMDESTQAAVMEMSGAHINNLVRYCRYFKPQIGIITTIGVDHLSTVKTLENYIKAKAKLLDGLGNKGTIILNIDDENTKKINLDKYEGKVIYFGFNATAGYAGSDLRTSINKISFTLEHDSKNYKVSIPVFGDFNAYNALAAIAATCEAGIKIEEAIESLKSFTNIERHVQLCKGIKGCTIIDDTWSTNPTSAKAALGLLKKYSNGKKTVAVLGRMGLLGDHSVEFHRQIGKQVAELGINYLITTDDESKYIGLGAKEIGMSADCIYYCYDKNQILSSLYALLDKNTIVLVKTSMLDSYGSLTDKLIKK